MTDDNRDDLEKQREALQTKLDEQGGLVVRGLMEQVDPAAATLLIIPSGSAFGDPQKIPAETVRTVHLMLPTGLQKPEGSGQVLTVDLKNGQRLEGHSPDYEEGCPAFTLLPKGERFIERILIFVHAVAEVQAGA